MQCYKKTFNHFIYFLLLSSLFGFTNAHASETIPRPIFKEPQLSFVKKDSIIQVPISIEAKDIRSAILKELNTPLASGSSGELKQQDIYRIFKTVVEIKYKVHLQDLKISFEGSKIKIFTSYYFDFSLDYKQRFIPFASAVKIKGALDGKAYANVVIVGDIQVNKDAKFTLKVLEENVKMKFTKVKIPSLLEKINFLNIDKVELFLAEELVEKSVNKRVYEEVQEQILKKQVDIQLHKKIQDLAHKNSFPLQLSRNLWLVPKPKKISLSQVSTKDNVESNKLYINIGITAQPELLTQLEEPLHDHLQQIPIVLETFQPYTYLYPTIHVKYQYIEQRIKKNLTSFLDKNYPNTSYTVNNIMIYPSDTKLVIAVDLVDKVDANKMLTFYLWGTPHLDNTAQTIQLKDFDYTLKSKNLLVHTAKWILDNRIKNLIQEKSIFSYGEKYSELSKKISSIEKATKNSIFSGGFASLKVQNLTTSKDELLIHLSTEGCLSCTVNLRK